MTRSLSLIAALGLTVLAASPAAAQAQASASSKTQASSKAAVAPSPTTMPRADERPISVDYYNVPLRDAITRLAVFGGRTVVMKADIGNPVVNASYADVHWRRALDLVLETQGLVAKDDQSGIIKVEKRERAVKR